MVETKKKLTRKQIVAIRKSLELATQLQRDFPEIADDFRNGVYTSEIVSKYNLIQRYGVSREVAQGAVYRALRGYKGGFGLDSYNGLINEGELEKLSKEHQSRSGSYFGPITYEKRLGIFSIPEEEMKDICKKAGKIGGKKIVELRLGIHGRTLEQMSEDGKTAVIARGQVPWEHNEGEYAYNLSQRSAYRIQKGPGKGKINTKLIAEEINEFYHNGNPVRSRVSIKKYLAKLRKQKGKTR